MDPAEAKGVLGTVEGVQSSTRAALKPSWLPYLVFGALTVASAPMTQVDDGAANGIYWLVAGPIGLAITWRYYRRHEIAIGALDRNEFLYAGIVAAMVLGAIAVGWLASDSFSEAGWALPIGAGILTFGVLERGVIEVAAGSAVLAFAGAVIAIDPSEAVLISALGTGAILLAAGVASLPRHGTTGTSRSVEPSPAR
jgi:hypothetical protein